jgi:hypothetical protein
MSETIPYENVHLRNTIVDRIAALNMTPVAFCEKVYGRDDKGKVKGTGAFYPVLKGTSPPSLATVERWAPVLQMEVAELRALAKVDELPAKRPYKKRKKQPVAAAQPWPVAQTAAQHVAMNGTAFTPPPRAAVPAVSTQPQFSLVVDQSGKATLRVNLLDVSLEVAMKAVNTLTTIGLLRTDAPKDETK